MVNKATGDAASASMRTTTSGGPASLRSATENSAPAAIDHGSGLLSAPRSARSSAARAPSPAASWACANAMHSEVVMNRSARMVQIIGPAAAGPSSATSSGTPMNPVFGNAATSAPKAASFRCTRSPSVKAMAANTISSAHTTYTASRAGFSNSSTGVFMPKRNSMHGNAKYSTKAFRPGIALSGSTPRCAASQPHSTSAKNGTVTARMACMLVRSIARHRRLPTTRR